MKQNCTKKLRLYHTRQPSQNQIWGQRVPLSLGGGSVCQLFRWRNPHHSFQISLTYWTNTFHSPHTSPHTTMFITQFHSQHKKMEGIFRKHWGILIEDPSLTTCLLSAPSITYRKARYIKYCTKQTKIQNLHHYWPSFQLKACINAKNYNARLANLLSTVRNL